MSDTIIAVILGIIEGLTEFLPVSSTGHMILAGKLLGFENETSKVFEVFIQLGAILSILFLYKERFQQMRSFKRPNLVSDGLTVYHVAAAIVPVMGIGFLLHGFIKTYLFSAHTVVIGLIAGALLMLVAERFAPRIITTDIGRMTVKQAFWVGLFQCLSLWPGFSRSGSTIAGGLFFGMSRTAAAEFSFIIAVPVMLIACIYDLLKSLSILSTEGLVLLGIGFVVSFIFAYLSVVWFIGFLNKQTLASFAYYRYLVAGVFAWYLGSYPLLITAIIAAIASLFLTSKIKIIK